MERDEWSTGQDSVTPTQAMPNALNVSGGVTEAQTRVEDEGDDTYNLHRHESFVSRFPFCFVLPSVD